MTSVAYSKAQSAGGGKSGINNGSAVAPNRSDMALALLLEQLVRLIYPERSPQDMHPGQWAALRYLSRANLEACTVVGLSRYLGITQGPASRAITALERKELIAGTRDKQDRRVIRLSLTEKGAALLQQDPIERLATLIGGLDHHQQATMTVVIDRLFNGLSPRIDAFTLHDHEPHSLA